MPSIIIRDFTFDRDFRSVQWGATLVYNLVRAFCAGIVWGVILFVISIVADDPTYSRGMDLLYASAMPLWFVLVILPMGLVCEMLRQFFPIIRNFYLFLAFSIAVGDPIVCIIKLYKPMWIPVEEPSIFGLNLIFFVLDAPDFAIAGEGVFKR